MAGYQEMTRRRTGSAYRHHERLQRHDTPAVCIWALGWTFIAYEGHLCTAVSLRHVKVWVLNWLRYMSTRAASGGRGAMNVFIHRKFADDGICK